MLVTSTGPNASRAALTIASTSAASVMSIVCASDLPPDLEISSATPCSHAEEYYVSEHNGSSFRRKTVSQNPSEPRAAARIDGHTILEWHLHPCARG